MPNIQIKDVPEETHAVLRERAAAAHQSLQEYLRSLLIDAAEHPPIDDVIAGARRRVSLTGSVVSAESILAARDDDRR